MKVTVTVNAPVETVWDVFMNPDQLKNWLTGFVSIDHLTGTKGQAGSTSKLRFKERGRVLEVTETVLHIVPGKQYSFNMHHEKLDTLTDVHFISVGPLTEIVQAVQFSPKGFFSKLIMPFMQGEMKRRMSNDLRRLKELIEKY